jgi:hypothetical protein
LPGEKIRFKNWIALKQLREKIKELDWLMSNCEIDEDLLGLAKNTIDMRIPIAFSPIKYEKKLKSQIKDCEYTAVFRYTRQEEIERYRKKQWLENQGHLKGVDI